MYGEEEGGHHDNEDDGREEDGHLVPSEHVAVASPCLSEQAFGNENAVVDTHTEDEGGDNDVDEVELQAYNSHVALHHEPTEHHGDEGQERGDDVAERDQQDQQDEQRGDPYGDVEVVVDDLHHALAVVERLQDECLGIGNQRVGGDVFLVESHGDVGEDHVLAVGIAFDEVA